MSQDQLPTSLTSKQHCASAFVTVDGIRAKVYGIEEAGNKVSGFIESKEGAGFVVTVLDDQVNPIFDRLTRLFLDGTKVDGHIVTKDDARYRTFTDNSSRERNFAGTEIAHNLQRPFVFAKPRLTDDDEIACQKEEIIQNLGTIQVEIYRAKKGKVVETPTYVLPQEIIIDERVKKATLSHQIGFQKAVAVDSNFHYNVTLIDPENSPQFAFEFKYLSRALLELKGYIESAPQEEERQISPTPPAQKSLSNVSNHDNGEDDDDEEDEACLARLEADVKLAEAKAAVLEQKAKMSKKKGRSSSEDTKSNKKVKVEDGIRVKKEVDDRDLGTIIIQDDSDED